VLSFIVDLDKRGLVQSIGSTTAASVPPLTVGEIHDTTTVFQKKVNGVVTTQDYHTGYTLKIGIGLLAIPPTIGTFTLTFGAETTDSIAYNATAAVISARLQALTAIGTGNVSVTGDAGGPWTVEFIGDLAETDVDALVGDGENLYPDSYVIIGTGRAGGTGINEIQEINLEQEPATGVDSFSIESSTPWTWTGILPLNVPKLKRIVSQVILARELWLEFELTNTNTGTRDKVLVKVNDISDGVIEDALLDTSFPAALDALYLRKADPSDPTSKLEWSDGFKITVAGEEKVHYT